MIDTTNITKNNKGEKLCQWEKVHTVLKKVDRANRVS